MSFLTHSSRGHARSQRGMALLISLIVLVVVSILGITAMRTALFQNRVSVNSQTSALAFQGAESGLDGVVNLAVAQIDAGVEPANPAHIFNKALNIKPQRVCITATGATTDDKAKRNADGSIEPTEDCPVIADSNVQVTTVVGEASGGSFGGLEGFDTKYGGSLIRIETRAYSEVPNTNVETVHAQEWGMLGPSDTEGG